MTVRPMDDSDREYFRQRYTEIAERMEHLGLMRGNTWGVETAKGRVYRFKCDRSYAKRGTQAWQEEGQMRAQLAEQE